VRESKPEEKKKKSLNEGKSSIIGHEDDLLARRKIEGEGKTGTERASRESRLVGVGKAEKQSK
jgi:hypothetical protein